MQVRRGVIVLIAAAFILASGPAAAAITKVKDIGTGSCGPNNPSCFATVAVPAVPAGGVIVGNLLVVSVAGGGDTGATLAVTDARGNSYTQDGESGGYATNRKVFIHHSRITTALLAGDLITVTITSPINNGVACAFSIAEFTGVSASPLDNMANAVGSSTAPNSGIAVTGQANELLVGAIGGDAPTTPTFGVGASYTALPSMTSCCSAIFPEFRVVSATGSYVADGTFTPTGPWGAIIATYRDAVAPVELMKFGVK
jgi:hypothetical protein